MFKVRHPLNSSQARELIANAKAGDRDATGKLLEAYRAYLKTATEGEIDDVMKARVDVSDIVQQTCLSAIRKIGDFGGSSQGQFVAWLNKIHERNIQDAIRHNKHVEKRAVSKEQPFQGSSSPRPEPPDHGETPSQHVVRRESADELNKALACLPADQREVVRLRCFEGWEFQRIASHLDRSHDSVASLLKRGLRNLRKHYNTLDS